MAKVKKPKAEKNIPYRNSRIVRFAFTAIAIALVLPLFGWWLSSMGSSGSGDGAPAGVGPFTYYPDDEAANGVLIVFLIYACGMWALSDVAGDWYLDRANGYTRKARKAREAARKAREAGSPAGPDDESEDGS